MLPPVERGFKVVCEMVLIATGQGYLQPGQQVLAIAGTHRGSDTVVVATAASFSNFKDFEINESCANLIDEQELALDGFE
jgi:hypothetical protein